MELYNSFTVLLISYCLLSFTSFVQDVEARYSVGYALTALTLQNIIVNLVVIAKDPVHKAKLWLKRTWNRR